MPEAIAIGSGRIPFGSDFVGTYAAVVVDAGGQTSTLPGDIGYCSVNEGSFTSVVDESGGILGMVADSGNDDNAVIMCGKFSPRDGKMVVRARFKYSDVDCAVFVGFTETLVIATPVMPAEFASAAMTYNGTGGMLGLQYDVDGTTDDFRAVIGDGGAAISDSSAGIRASATVTADRWMEAEVIMDEDGGGECWLGQSGNANALNMNKLSLVKRFSTGTLLTNTDLFYAVLMIENRTANARTLEVDYFTGETGRDWRY